MEKTRNIAQVQAEIKFNEETWEMASATLREILDESKPRRPYYLERLTAQLNLCTEIAGKRAQLEYELLALRRRGE